MLSAGGMISINSVRERGRGDRVRNGPTGPNPCFTVVLANSGPTISEPIEAQNLV